LFAPERLAAPECLNPVLAARRTERPEMRAGVWVLMAAIAVPIAACEREAQEDSLTAGSNMLTDDEVDRALGPETQAQTPDQTQSPAQARTQAPARAGPDTQASPANGEADQATPPQAEEEEE
jgi:hypothetical protein